MYKANPDAAQQVFEFVHMRPGVISHLLGADVYRTDNTSHAHLNFPAFVTFICDIIETTTQNYEEPSLEVFYNEFVRSLPEKMVIVDGAVINDQRAYQPDAAVPHVRDIELASTPEHLVPALSRRLGMPETRTSTEDRTFYNRAAFMELVCVLLRHLHALPAAETSPYAPFSQFSTEAVYTLTTLMTPPKGIVIGPLVLQTLH